MWFGRNKNKDKNIKSAEIINRNNLLIECKQLEKEGNRNLAIEKLKNYVEEEKKLGETFTYLMELYNKNLSDARKNGDEVKIQESLNDIDELMKKSKDIMRGR